MAKAANLKNYHLSPPRLSKTDSEAYSENCVFGTDSTAVFNSSSLRPNALGLILRN
jgi:hypothetical protein